MQTENLADFPAGSTFNADLVIVGSGPAAYAIAHELAETTIKILIVESGLSEETAQHGALNRTEKAGEPKSAAQVEKRIEFHSGLIPSWSNDDQPYGVRNRCLGGSTRSWAGKSAAFQPIDFEARDWAPHTGWPFDEDEVAPYLDRAASILNLGPNCYDEKLFEQVGATPPQPAFDRRNVCSFFWQFARSRIDKLDTFRVGPELVTLKASNIRILVNATATHIDTNDNDTAFTRLEVSTIDGARSFVDAKAAVLATGGIENPRLMLASNRIHAKGVGNKNDTVGRYFMDHPGARVGRFSKEDANAVNDRFGFYGVKDDAGWHLYMHGVALSDEVQADEGLANCALYLLEDRAPDDPWDAIKRLMKFESQHLWRDVRAVAASPFTLANGAAMMLFSSDAIPQKIKGAVVNFMIARIPNFAVNQQLRRGVPHKLDGLFVDVITEQFPDPESRVLLSDEKDALGTPLARIDWRIGDVERRSMIRLSQLFAAELERAGLPAPALDDWVKDGRADEGVIIDMAHPMGATRMSEDPRDGVVDPDCRVHGIENLYVAGSSVFPTSSHVNPTLMIVALATRLADHLKYLLMC